MLLPRGLSYHQKATLVENIARYISQAEAQSLLDIGAGSLETALPLSKLVRRYCAVEKDGSRAAALKKAGLNVVRGAFPLPISGTFDFVVSSHSIPERSLEAYIPFLSACWNSIRAGGMLLIVTFKGGLGDLAEVERELLDRARRKSLEFNAIIDFCGRLGATNVERVNSFVEAARADEIVRFLGPWISGVPETRRAFHDHFARIVEIRHKVRDGLFVFPTEHLFISCRKP